MRDIGFELAMPVAERNFLLGVTKQFDTLRHAGLAALLPLQDGRASVDPIDRGNFTSRMGFNANPYMIEDGGLGQDFSLVGSFEHGRPRHTYTNPSSSKENGIDLGLTSPAVTSATWPSNKKSATATVPAGVASLGARSRTLGRDISVRQSDRVVPNLVLHKSSLMPGGQGRHAKNMVNGPLPGPGITGLNGQPAIRRSSLRTDTNLYMAIAAPTATQSSNQPNGPAISPISAATNRPSTTYAAPNASQLSFTPNVGSWPGRGGRSTPSTGPITETAQNGTARGRQIQLATTPTASDSDDSIDAPSNLAIHGDVYLDGALLGKWVSRSLAREAARSPAGGAAFDPRRNALPTGRMIGT